MSFATTFTDVSVANNALSHIAQTPIASLSDSGIAARECRLFYPGVIRALLEKHHFGLATVTAPLVAHPTILSSNRWLYVYELPNDAASIVSIEHPAVENSGYYTGLAAFIGGEQQKFQVEGRAVYTNIADAVGRYVSLNTTEDQFTQELVDVASAKLASKIAMPVAKRKDLRDEYSALADTLLNQLLARELNRAGQTYGDSIGETEMARMGLY